MKPKQQSFLSSEEAFLISYALCWLVGVIGVILIFIVGGLWKSGKFDEYRELFEVTVSYVVFPFGPCALVIMLDQMPFWAKSSDTQSEHIKSSEKQERVKYLKDFIELLLQLSFIYLAFWRWGESYKWHWLTYCGVGLGTLAVLFLIYSIVAALKGE